MSNNMDEFLKCYVEQKDRQKSIHTALFYLCEVQKQEKLICGKRSE